MKHIHCENSLTKKKKNPYPRDIGFAQAAAEIEPPVETDEKCCPPPARGADMLPSQIPTVPSPFDFHASFKMTGCGDRELGIIFSLAFTSDVTVNNWHVMPYI